MLGMTRSFTPPQTHGVNPCRFEVEDFASRQSSAAAHFFKHGADNPPMFFRSHRIELAIRPHGGENPDAVVEEVSNIVSQACFVQLLVVLKWCGQNHLYTPRTFS